MPMLKRFVISPPFGNLLQVRGCTSVIGSFTVNPRAGMIGAYLRTFRKTKGGWINKIGLKNGGLASAVMEDHDMVSIAAPENEWWLLRAELECFSYSGRPDFIELNLSCPNIDEKMIISNADLKFFCQNFPTSVKVQVNTPLTEIERLLTNGCQWLHLSNTLPSPRGGISGTQLRIQNLPYVEAVKKAFPLASIIAGGGIYDFQDFLDYRNAGAEHFSLGTIFLNPLKAHRFFACVKSNA